jgi:sialate O-acetylesterase
VPIGLIHTSWGGTPSEAWTRREILEKEPDAAPILERHDEAVAKYPEAKKEYEQKVEEWKKTAEQAKSENKPAPQRPWPPLGPGHSHSPSGLYNAMLAPLIPYGIKGAIWYQGETNAGRAYQYRKLFPAMIKNWRNDWGQGDFPFLFVQLANYMAVKPEPVESYWAELREAQLMTLDLPNTGMAVIIDIGEADDIHPRNKQDVGKRLALWSLAKSYGKELVYSGPIFKSMTIKNGKAILNFDHVGGGLIARPNEPLKGFAIAGADRKFVWADAKIEGNQIVVSSDKVINPVAVRYAWADNPVCNLYNKEGLPASPFRTDDWPGVTINNK